MVLGCLGVFGLVVAVTGGLAALNWEDVTRRLTQVLDTQTEKAQIALFRVGELGSIGARIKSEYGVTPELTYRTETERRVLGITWTDSLPDNVTAEDHARELAVFSLQQTKKAGEIDTIEVVFRIAGQDPDVVGFAIGELVGDPRETED